MNVTLKTLLLAALINVCSLTACLDAESASSKKIKIEKEKIDTAWHDGDIIFQTSRSGQSLAIQYATHSKYSHCGLLFQDNGHWYVYEAIQPVVKTPVKEFIARGDSDYFVIKRLAKNDSILTPAVMEKMRASVHKRLGKNYDLWFGWSDENVYCSELVWKAYHESTGLKVGELQPLKTYDLTHPLVQKHLKERYGKKIPYDEPMISPGSIFDSPLLVIVKN
ncbi:MAG TPA: YiiX family permuted papain-like enzyme [Bacteroidia bacterium]|nr:YiiX family permuted papain-like enzyme [Bacteroidia bacterium]